MSGTAAEIEKLKAQLEKERQERRESHERHEQERRESRERHEQERRESRERHEQERRESRERHEQEVAHITQEKQALCLRILQTSWTRLHDMAESHAHTKPRSHESAQRIEMESIDWASIVVPDEVWDTMYTPSPESGKVKEDWGEVAVVDYLVDILRAIIRGFGVERRLVVVKNRIVAGIECDIVLLYGIARIPIFVIEAKKPHSEEDDAEIFALKSRVAGQNFDQLHNLALLGFERAYGAISTKEKTVLTCTNEFSISTKDTLQVDFDDENGLTSPLKTCPFRIRGHSSSSKKLMDSTTNRVLYSSQIVEPSRDRNGANFVKLLCVLVCKACKEMQSLRPVDLGGTMHSRLLRLCRKNSSSDSAVSCCSERHTFATFHPSSGTDFKNGPPPYLAPIGKKQQDTLVHLVRHLGHGENGDCCLGLSRSGACCCVVKFFHVLGGLELASRECSLWNTIYQEHGFKCYFGTSPSDCPFLIMPYLQPLTCEERSRVLAAHERELRRALLKFAGPHGKPNCKKFYLHRDMGWRHVGYYRRAPGKNNKEGERTLCFSDLGCIDVTTDMNEVNEWIEKCVSTLKEKSAVLLESKEAQSTFPSKKRASRDKESPTIGRRRSKRICHRL